MSFEIERKYLINSLPGLENIPFEEILQGYLLVTDEKEVRIRKKGEKYYQASKVGSGLKRHEIEKEIGVFQFEDLWPETEGKRIEKRRYNIAYGDLLIELDVYSGHLSGLVVAEVEFDTEAESQNFDPPSWFGPEVTHDGRYKNKNLAIRGIPDSSSLPQ